MSTALATAAPSFDLATVRAAFPALRQEVHPGKPLVYLDSAATALKPQPVLDATMDAYAKDVANVHRAVHALSQRATARYEGARDTVRDFLGAAAREEIVFVRGASEALNLVASSWGGANLSEGDEILLTELEHHSNIVPWQLVAERTGARVVHVPITDAGEVTLEAFEAKLSAKTKVCAFAHISNSLGTVLPVQAMAERAHAAGASVVVDGAQGVVHGAVDVRALGVDFYAFSGHKLYGPTGIGVLWGRRERLDEIVPQQGGGEMISIVEREASRFKEVPHRLEAGTPHIAGALGLHAALDWYAGLDQAALHAHEARLLAEATVGVEARGGRVIGAAPGKVAALSFVMEGIHPHDLGTILDHEGVAIRGGHHCAEPLMDALDLEGTARASFGAYNDHEDVAALLRGLERARALFAPSP